MPNPVYGFGVLLYRLKIVCKSKSKTTPGVPPTAATDREYQFIGICTPKKPPTKFAAKKATMPCSTDKSSAAKKRFVRSMENKMSTPEKIKIK